LAKLERLGRFKDLEYIDSIVGRSNGAYTHDEVFNLEAGFAHSLLLMYYEQSAYQLRADSIRMELQQKQTT